jgi:hypothetical protein
MHPALRHLAEPRLGVFTSAEARQVGYSPDEIKTALGSGRWRRLRRGIYIASEDLQLAEQDPRLRHIVECMAVVLRLDAGPVVSHASAARLHRLLVPEHVGGTVRLTDPSQWRRGRGYEVARASLSPPEVVQSQALLATGVSRTLVDCAREWSLEDSVVAIDAAIQGKQVTRAELEAAVLAARHWLGIGSAARALNMADGRAESPLESRGRLALLASGLPRPELQVKLFDARGFIARVDAWYEEAAVALEFDGKIKYLEPREGRSPNEILWEEKRREDRVRAVDARMVRLAQEDMGRRWDDAVANLRRLLAVPLTGPRRFTVVRTPEPGTPLADAAA